MELSETLKRMPETVYEVDCLLEELAFMLVNMQADMTLDYLTDRQATFIAKVNQTDQTWMTCCDRYAMIRIWAYAQYPEEYEAATPNPEFDKKIDIRESKYYNKLKVAMSEPISGDNLVSLIVICDDILREADPEEYRLAREVFLDEVRFAIDHFNERDIASRLQAMPDESKPIPALA